MIPLPQKPKLVQKKGNSATFEIEGLFPGYGVTLGNALRRVLLSSLEGAAITTVKIKGVSHEFSTIPHVLEDVVEILLNLKQIRFKMHGNEPQKASLSVKGEQEVNAQAIKASPQLEIINKDSHIATVTDKKGELEMELLIERGLGYSTVEQRKKEKLEVGTMGLDAIFTPVRMVNFEVENMRVGERTDFNRLRIFIETDGIVSPERALKEAGEILVSQLDACIPEVKEEVKKAGEAEELKEISEMKIEDLKISTRTKNALMVGGIKTLGGLSRKSKESLREIEGLGDKGLREIERVLKKHDLELKG